MFISLPNPPKLLTKAYTLIELLIVMSIVVLMFSVGTASYRNYQQRQFFESNVQKVVSDLRLAQEFATAGQIFDQASCVSPFQGYSFERVNNSTYAISQVCNFVRREYKRATLGNSSTNVAITIRGNNAGDTNFVFRPQSRGLDITPISVNNGCVTITSGTNFRIISVNRVTGAINFATSCP